LSPAFFPHVSCYACCVLGITASNGVAGCDPFPLK
jgi:hypothetical protein